MAKATGGGRVAARDRALGYVKTRILSGAFPGGELISEGEIADALGMSRTPVREAFLRLEAEGLLRLYPQRGALVVQVSPEEVRAVMEARLVLEQFAAGKVVRLGAAARGTAFERLDAELQRQRRLGTQPDIDEFLDADRAFHTIIMETAGNPILGDVHTALRDRQMRMIGQSLRDPQRITTILVEHARIAEAVRDGDLDRAVDAVRVHLASTVRTLGLAVEPESRAGADHLPGEPVGSGGSPDDLADRPA
jgi:DNA-binding GntR family transcriptional regulator